MCRPKGKDESFPLKSVSGPPRHQFPEQQNPVGFRLAAGSARAAEALLGSGIGGGGCGCGDSSTLGLGIRSGNVCEKVETRSQTRMLKSRS